MKYFTIVLYNRGLGDNIMAYHFYKSLSIFCLENNVYVIFITVLNNMI